MFSDRLKKARKERGWTQVDLANESDVGVATIRRYETNQRTPKENSAELKILAETLGVYSEWLLTGRGFKNHKEEFIHDIENDPKKAKAAKRAIRVLQLHQLHSKIEEVFYPTFCQEVFPQSLAGSDLDNLNKELDLLTDDEAAFIEKYVAAQRKMNRDIDNYIAIRTQKFMDEIKEK